MKPVHGQHVLECNPLSSGLRVFPRLWSYFGESPFSEDSWDSRLAPPPRPLRAPPAPPPPAQVARVPRGDPSPAPTRRARGSPDTGRGAHGGDHRLPQSLPCGRGPRASCPRRSVPDASPPPAPRRLTMCLGCAASGYCLSPQLSCVGDQGKGLEANRSLLESGEMVTLCLPRLSFCCVRNRHSGYIC